MVVILLVCSPQARQFPPRLTCASLTTGSACLLSWAASLLYFTLAEEQQKTEKGVCVPVCLV